jgi:hypothetical protein
MGTGCRRIGRCRFGGGVLLCIFSRSGNGFLFGFRLLQILLLFVQSYTSFTI